MATFQRFNHISIFLLLLTFSFSLNISGQNRTISMDVDVTSTAINRFIAAQTFPTLTGSASGYTYTISITKPIIQLNINSASVQFTINAITSAGNFSFNVQPTIIIPPLNVSVSQIMATLEGFDDLINASLDIPSWLKPIIIAGYNNLNLIIYPSKLIDYANTAVPDFINVQVIDIGISFAVLPNLLRFTLSAVVHGEPPVMQCEWMIPTAHQISIRFKSNVGTKVKQVRIWNSLSEEIYSSTNLNISISKNGYSASINPSAYGCVA
ncbi:MAG: hypothetical protein WAV89_07780 [Ignavibacteriaceae bacterium]